MFTQKGGRKTANPAMGQLTNLIGTIFLFTGAKAGLWQLLSIKQRCH
jgi:hypothetical protein